MFGVVAWVQHGNTVVAEIDGKQELVRLPGIEAPKPGKPYGVEAGKFVQSKVLGKKVEIRPSSGKKRKSYGRLLADVVVDGERVSEALVREGLAWWVPKYAPTYSKLGDAQDEARKLKKNLWSSSAADTPEEPPDAQPADAE